ncbi:hypothetical protein K9L63_03620, partial [Candidatus Gracilibacteria bacterium]|nr:hypothetical protein [Candidatus Gracilibacteria bacterium]
YFTFPRAWATQSEAYVSYAPKRFEPSLKTCSDSNLVEWAGRNPLKNARDLSTRPALEGLGRDDNTEGIFFHLCNFIIG